MCLMAQSLSNHEGLNITIRNLYLIFLTFEMQMLMENKKYASADAY